MLEARDDLRAVKDLPDAVQGEARSNIYRSWKELTGMIEPSSPKLKQKAVKGLLRWALGNSPKTSAVMQKMLTSTVDTVGRGVIAPDPSLRLDEIGIPKSIAFQVYKPFVTRALVNMNYTPLEAMKQVEKQTPVATDVLMQVMEKRPAILNRAPSLHKFSLMGFKPKMTAGHIIRVNPSVVGPFAADMDGDQMNVHVPVSDAAVREVYEKMLPQQNLLSVRKHSIQYPLEKEYRQGIYLASRMKSDKAERVVDSIQEAIRMYNNNEIDIDTPIEIKHK
jgi:DNA-directed RNA polymerase subunit beta'